MENQMNDLSLDKNNNKRYSAKKEGIKQIIEQIKEDSDGDEHWQNMIDAVDCAKSDHDQKEAKITDSTKSRSTSLKPTDFKSHKGLLNNIPMSKVQSVKEFEDEGDDEDFDDEGDSEFADSDDDELIRGQLTLACLLGVYRQQKCVPQSSEDRNTPSFQEPQTGYQGLSRKTSQEASGSLIFDQNNHTFLEHEAQETLNRFLMGFLFYTACL